MLTPMLITLAMFAFTLDPQLVVQLLVAVVLPLLVGLITQRVTASGVKAILLALVALVSSMLIELGDVLLTGGVYDIGLSLLAALPTFLVAVGMHYGLWKPVGASAAAQRTFAGNQATTLDPARDITGDVDDAGYDDVTDDPYDPDLDESGVPAVLEHPGEGLRYLDVRPPDGQPDVKPHPAS
ncbi:hypothetical protein [Auraticoccus monumenti]|uniref:Uncharacterized protein n=1 Tax=Auraticoccus monumenti TaxID=675864 RepID=A0A1G6UG79_9ACTN|nr:hypothetical protein [Auraticoccus monumenti]SDD40303.1 hypothetical protein SAMN04489747_0877 [Auraticoccus monumenti]